jgi:hypothetical protein
LHLALPGEHCPVPKGKFTRNLEQTAYTETDRDSQDRIKEDKETRNLT